MAALVVVVVIVGVLALIALMMSIRVVKQYERGVLFRFGRLLGEKEPGLRRLRSAMRRT